MNPQKLVELKKDAEEFTILPGQITADASSRPVQVSAQRPAGYAHELSGRFFAAMLIGVHCAPICDHTDCARRKAMKSIAGTYPGGFEIPDLQGLVIDAWKQQHRALINANRLQFACRLILNRANTNQFINDFKKELANKCEQKQNEVSPNNLAIKRPLRFKIFRTSIERISGDFNSSNPEFSAEDGSLTAENWREVLYKKINGLGLNEFCLIGFSDNTVRCAFNRDDEQFLSSLSIDQLNFILGLPYKHEANEQQAIKLDEEKFKHFSSFSPTMRKRLYGNSCFDLSPTQEKALLKKTDTDCDFHVEYIVNSLALDAHLLEDKQQSTCCVVS
jgi:hypothetical protein